MTFGMFSMATRERREHGDATHVDPDCLIVNDCGILCLPWIGSATARSDDCRHEKMKDFFPVSANELMSSAGPLRAIRSRAGLHKWQYDYEWKSPASGGRIVAPRESGEPAMWTKLCAHSPPSLSSVASGGSSAVR